MSLQACTSTHISLKRHTLIHAEQQNHMPAHLESIRQQLLVLFLRRPHAIAHGRDDIVVVPGFDHEVANTFRIVHISISYKQQ